MADETKEATKEEKAPKIGRLREGLTEAQVLQRREQLSADEVPEGYVKLSEIADLCRAEGVPVSKLVRATGGDRAINPPADPVFQVTFVGRTRYLAPAVKTKGMELLKSPDFLRTRRSRKAKKEDGDGETGPVKSAKRVVRKS